MSWMQEKTTMQKVTDYLFGSYDSEELKSLDFRTILPTTEVFKTVSYYRILEKLGCENAKSIADIIESLLVSAKGVGRQQAVEVLKQRFFPRTERVYSAIESTGSVSVAESTEASEASGEAVE